LTCTEVAELTACSTLLSIWLADSDGMPLGGDVVLDVDLFVEEFVELQPATVRAATKAATGKSPRRVTDFTR
jgi:hypothetical protein